MALINPSDPTKAAITIIIDNNGKRRTEYYETARNIQIEENFLNPREFHSSSDVSLQFRAIADVDTKIWRTVEFSDLNEQGLDDKFIGSKWWRALDSNGDLEMETSNIQDFKTLGIWGVDGYKFQQLWVKTENVWVDATPVFLEAGNDSKD